MFSAIKPQIRVVSFTLSDGDLFPVHFCAEQVGTCLLPVKKTDLPPSLCALFNLIKIWHTELSGSPIFSQFQRRGGTDLASSRYCLFMLPFYNVHGGIIQAAEEGRCLAAVTEHSA